MEDEELFRDMMIVFKVILPQMTVAALRHVIYEFYRLRMLSPSHLFLSPDDYNALRHDYAKEMQCWSRFSPLRTLADESHLIDCINPVNEGPARLVVIPGLEPRTIILGFFR